MVMAAGSVMKEPRMGPMVRMQTQKAAGPPPSKRAAPAMEISAARRTGRLAAMDMMTTTNMGSVKWTSWLM